MADYALGSTIDVKFATRSAGAMTTLSGGTVAAYPDNSTTEITAGITLTTDIDSRTGLHNVRVVATSGNGYASGSRYTLVVTAGTVGGTSVVGMPVGAFSLEAESALRPATAGRTAAVDASGQVTVGAMAADTLTASALASDAVTEIQSGLATSSALSSLQSDVTTLLGRITSTLFSGITSLAQWLGAMAGKQTGNSTARTEIRATGAGSGTYDETTDSQEALRDRGDAAWTTATGFSTLDASGVRSAVGLASANLDTQLGDLPTNAELATALAGADDAVLAAIAALNNLSSAGAQSAAAAALTAYGAALQSDIPTAAQIADKLLGRNLGAGSDGGRTVQDALRASRNRVVIDGSTITVYAEDDSTPAWVGTVVRVDLDALQEVNPS